MNEEDQKAAIEYGTHPETCSCKGETLNRDKQSGFLAGIEYALGARRKPCLGEILDRTGFLAGMQYARSKCKDALDQLRAKNEKVRKVAEAAKKQRTHFAKYGAERLTAQDVQVILAVNQALAELKEEE